MYKAYPQTQPKTQEEKEKPFLQTNPFIALETSDYLERHIASKKISKLKEQVEKNLRNLGKIIKNYESQLQDSKKNYEEAFNQYKTGMESYYSGDILKAYNHLLKSKSMTNQLLLEYSKIYKNKAVEITTKIATKISDLESNSLNAPYFLIHSTDHRLTVIKNKIGNGDELTRFNQYLEAIELYRNAIILGIISLYNIEQDKTKKEEILKEFKTDLEDANYNTESIRLESF